LTVKSVVEVKRRLDQLVEDGEPVRIYAGAVAKVDALGVQLLLAFSRPMGSRGLSVDWCQPEKVLVEACAQLGVEIPALCDSAHDAT
jgi:hypothetical protein